MSEKIDKLPLGWVDSSLDVILEDLQSGKRPSGGVSKYTSGIPSLGGEHLTNEGKFNFQNISFIPLTFFESLSSGKIKSGDILLVKDGATTGKVSYVDDDYPYSQSSVNEHLFILRPKIIEPEFLFYYLLSPYGQHQIKHPEKTPGLMGITGLIGGINSKFIINFPIPIPPLPEQKRIVSKIKIHTKNLDLIIKIHEELIFKIKQFPQALLNHHYSKFLKKPLADLDCNLIAGQHILESNYNQKKIGIPYLTGPSDFLEDFPIITKWTEYPKSIAQKNDILITVKGAGVGKINFLNQEKACISRQLMAIRSNVLEPFFVYYSLKNQFYELKTLGKTLIAGTHQQKILDFPIAVADHDVQIKTIDSITEELSKIANIKKLVLKNLSSIYLLKKSILKQAIEGKLVSQDSNDEPASDLLKRIKNQ